MILEILGGVDRLVDEELERANEKFPLFSSPHEGAAVIWEEIQEAEENLTNVKNDIKAMWGCIRSNEDVTRYADILRSTAADLAAEAIQVSAMAKKFEDSAIKGRWE